MLIVLEGCDATGKTTLANLLGKTFNADVVHCTTSTPNTFTFFRDLLYASERQNIIADRFCYGQFVYQDENERPIYEGYEGDTIYASWGALYALEAQMLSHGAKVIYTYSSIDKISDRMIARGENPSNVAGLNMSISQICRSYEDLWDCTLIKPIRFQT